MDKNVGIFFILVTTLYLSVYDIMLTVCVSPVATIVPVDRF